MRKKIRNNRFKKLNQKRARIMIKGTAERPRLSVYRSNKNIYAQVINDENLETLVSFSTLTRFLELKFESIKSISSSFLLGHKLAELCLKKNITTIVFDRGISKYHGHMQALADGARSGGLEF